MAAVHGLSWTPSDGFRSRPRGNGGWQTRCALKLLLAVAQGRSCRPAASTVCTHLHHAPMITFSPFAALADSTVLDIAQDLELVTWTLESLISEIVVWMKPGAFCMIVLSSEGLGGFRCAARAGTERARSGLGGFFGMTR